MCVYTQAVESAFGNGIKTIECVSAIQQEEDLLRDVCKLKANPLPTPQTDWAQRNFQSNQIGLICRAH